METSRGELAEVVQQLRSVGTDLRHIEAKAAVGGLPKSLWPTISAFSNHGGGVVLLGLDESDGFLPAEGFDAIAIRDAVADAFRPRRAADGAGPITPRPLGTIDVDEVGGSPVVVIDVAELPPSQKPSFVTAQGKEGGTYERVGDGDRRMSTYGVFLLSTDGAQPHEDSTMVDGASIDDLDPGQVSRFIARVRRTRPRSVADLSHDADILHRHNVLAADRSTPTLAGLLALGRYPQQFYPQAIITFAVYPGRTKADVIGDVRMLDRRIIEGSIPVMVDDAVLAILENLKTRRISRGAGAVDEPEVPVDALREAVTNALTHRDYSAWALGEQVRVEMFPDRIEVSNPGGIWGGRRVVDLYDGSSRSRNQVLAALLTEVPLPGRDESVSENAGSGIPRMTGVLGRAGLPAPKFLPTVTSMTVVLDRHGLLNPDSSDWLRSIGADSLEPDLQRALVLVHRGNAVDDQILRAALVMDSEDAKHVLRRLVDDGWLAFPPRIGETYRSGRRLIAGELNARSLFEGFPVEVNEVQAASPLDERILNAVRERGELGINELARYTQSTPGALRPRLRVLVAQGALIATAPAQSKHRRYRIGDSTAL
ncbi:ATP-binding protein [Agromyces bauzanensis]|uniref:Transcriptional regulator n=1 Tax=Agromyces bauzanensis TaxID=1308924 RepID=A0A917UPX9_9MICO|nr:ATP-binding protein [Agromyces bauzanensis]GGJ73830.1 transcriptional regulator [Agromyces bauzanensis]